MKNLKESFGFKTFIVFVLGILLTVIPICGIGVVFLCEDILEKDEGSTFSLKLFEETEQFSRLFNTRVLQLNEYLQLKNVLETNNQLDYEKVIVEIKNPDSGNITYYTIGELLKSNSFYVEDIIDDIKSSGIHSLKEDTNFNQNTGHFIISWDKENNIYKTEWVNHTMNTIRSYTKLQNEYVFDTIDSAESYWYNRIEMQNTMEQQNQEAYNIYLEEPKVFYLLENLAYEYTYFVSYYLYYQELFDSVNSNFIYWMNIDGKDIRTNAPEEYLTEDTFHRFGIKLLGNLRYQTLDYTIDTNIPYINRYYIDSLEKTLIGSSRANCQMHIGVLYDLPKKDVFSANARLYGIAEDILPILLYGAIISIFMSILCIIFLLSSAGHRKGKEEIVLTSFDKWFTEISVGCCLAALIICFYLFHKFIPASTENIDTINLFICAAIWIIIYGILMCMSASICRRMKVGTIWKKSLLRNIGLCIRKVTVQAVSLIKQIYRERQATTKIILLFGMFVVASSIIEFIALFSNNLLGISLSLLFYIVINGIACYYLLKGNIDSKHLIEGAEKIANGDLKYKIEIMNLSKENQRLADAINQICNGMSEAVEKSIKDERMKTDLITNVSHDIKTPLTSIINYVDLLKREKIQDEKIQSYIEVLDTKSQRLKNLTDDLVEASKLSSGNLVLIMEKINLVELVYQTNGEFLEKFAEKSLTIVPTFQTDSAVIQADGRRLWRVLENLYNNVAKYAMQGTRVYISIQEEDKHVSFIMKNISANPLNIEARELTERFIRGDISRSTEGSGLGLSIAKSLTELMNGTFDIYLDGDLFRVTLTFPIDQSKDEESLIENAQIEQQEIETSEK